MSEESQSTLLNFGDDFDLDVGSRKDTITKKVNFKDINPMKEQVFIDESFRNTINIIENENVKSTKYKESICPIRPELNFYIENKESLPPIFRGINTKTFGNSRDNPYPKLKAIALDEKDNFKDRCLAIRYIFFIPRAEKNKDTMESILSIIKNQEYTATDKYTFLAFHEQRDWTSEIAFPCFTFWFNNYPLPLQYKILSAQYFLENRVCNFESWVDLSKVFVDLDNKPLQHKTAKQVALNGEKLLLLICCDKDMSIESRSEASDILWRLGSDYGKAIGESAIEMLAELLGQADKEKGSFIRMCKSVYTNAENVHDKSINESVYKTLKTLIETVKPNPLYDFGFIYDRVVDIIKEEPKEKQELILKAFSRILIDTGKYQGVKLTYVLSLIYTKICENKDKLEMEKQLIEEIETMPGTCASGYLSRLINALSGFETGIDRPITISFESQLRSNIFGRLEAELKRMNVRDQTIIVEEMCNKKNTEKTFLMEFVDTYGPKPELEEEFVPKYLTKGIFDTVYKACINEYCGITEETHIKDKILESVLLSETKLEIIPEELEHEKEKVSIVKQNNILSNKDNNSDDEDTSDCNHPSPRTLKRILKEWKKVEKEKAEQEKRDLQAGLFRVFNNTSDKRENENLTSVKKEESSSECDDEGFSLFD